MKLTMQEAEEFLTLPEDTLIQVLVTEITEREVPGRDGKEGWTSLSFKFKILETPSQYDALIGSTIYGSVGSKLTNRPDNKLRQWVEALLGMEIGSGFEMDTETLVGRKARAVIGNYTKRDSTLVNHKVKGLLPLLSAAAIPVTPAQSSFLDEPPF